LAIACIVSLFLLSVIARLALTCHNIVCKIYSNDTCHR
jgi:hypothetical protein